MLAVKDKSIDSNLGIGPLSSEIIEAIFRYSNYYRKNLMIIASKNQIDHSGGYVNNWTTDDYASNIEKLKQNYPNAVVYICRDHCGPGFNGIYDLPDTYKTIEADIENGFDLIHIDFCHFQGTREERLEEAKKAIKHCLSLNPNISIEVGTDENIGTNYGFLNIDEIEAEVDFFKNFCKPEFFTVQTGSLVKEINQVGSFNKQFVESVSKNLGTRGIKLKEHNADYLSKEEIIQRRGIVSALNVAPQFGVIQTQFVLNKCLIYGINFNDFIEEIYRGGKWKKWLCKNSPENKFLCSIIAGHYHFSSDAYKFLIDKLEKYEDIQESIINEMMKLIDHYEQQ